MQAPETTADVARALAVCNACRYCEQYCPAFQALEQRLNFATADVNYLANLCHGCGECLYACQYAPPHEFAVNIPQAMAKVRVPCSNAGISNTPTGPFQTMEIGRAHV